MQHVKLRQHSKTPSQYGAAELFVFNTQLHDNQDFFSGKRARLIEAVHLIIHGRPLLGTYHLKWRLELDDVGVQAQSNGMAKYKTSGKVDAFSFPTNRAALENQRLQDVGLHAGTNRFLR
jgi:hypothetical protein